MPLPTRPLRRRFGIGSLYPIIAKDSDFAPKKGVGIQIHVYYSTIILNLQPFL